MNKLLSLTLLCLSLIWLPASAASKENLQFEDQIKLGNRDLQLNGLGIRQILWFKAYVAALYLSEKASTGQAAVSQAGPKRIQMRMMMEIGTNDVKKALIDGMRKNVNDAQWAAMQDRVARFAATIDSIGATRPGDTINLDFVPNQGLLLAVNDAPKGSAIPGLDFYNALLEIYVGEDPVDSRLKQGMLGRE
jgi:hypothetical protein